ncbi:unnamed protein product [Fraxinus pennsylvanica]|uniref:Uncharacterized protein n=1 Tax=Fraxinus pennsylvanica TaxID=56036 RepID=A0AAD2DTG3_9LAMI|nr:unnamed protein product [Fraxinus pennsylvanica]
MSSAEELFLNGKIRPMKLSSHLQMLQVLLPLVDLEGSGDDELGEENSTSMRGRDLRMRNPRYAHRKTRSMSSRYGCDGVSDGVGGGDDWGYRFRSRYSWWWSVMLEVVLVVVVVAMV